MMHFLLALTAIAVASDKPDALDSHAHLCSTHAFEADVFTSLRTREFCLQAVIVPSNQSATLFVANRDAYCAALEEDEKSLAKVSQGDASLVNFCSDSARAFSLTSGTYHIGVPAAKIPLQVSLTYRNTTLGCDDMVDDSLIDIPLTFIPTEHKCSIVLPGSTILQITKITRIGDHSKNHCPRVRMGKNFYSLNVRWAPVCEVSDNQTIEYDLGCGSIVMDASSLAIEKVEFVLRAMDEYKAVTAPLMCADNRDI